MSPEKYEKYINHMKERGVTMSLIKKIATMLNLFNQGKIDYMDKVKELDDQEVRDVIKDNELVEYVEF